jgi:ADP-ribose pyrophosphatase YjhB (NUDIX family)
MTDLPVRDTARGLVLDPEDRVLLIQYEAVRDVDPARPGLRAFWFTPGGGLEPGESYEEALRRELAEEIGVHDAALGPCVAYRETPFLLFRKQRFVRERHYVVRLANDAIDTARLAETEDNPVLGVRWWPLSELRGTADVIEPPGLVALTGRIVAGAEPAEPVRLGETASVDAEGRPA